MRQREENERRRRGVEYAPTASEVLATDGVTSLGWSESFKPTVLLRNWDGSALKVRVAAPSVCTTIRSSELLRPAPPGSSVPFADPPRFAAVGELVRGERNLTTRRMTLVTAPCVILAANDVNVETGTPLAGSGALITLDGGATQLVCADAFFASFLWLLRSRVKMAFDEICEA